MMKTLISLIAISMAALSFAPCPPNSTYDCFNCSKVVVAPWFNCCCTGTGANAGTCFQYECQQIECWLGMVQCPILDGGGGIERRNKTAKVGMQCNGATGVCY